MTASSRLFRVALIGCGAIGSRVAAAVRASTDLDLIGVVTRGRSTGSPSSAAVYPALTLDEASARADLIVECAGGDAVREYAARILDNGADLLISSIGALADPHLRNTLLADTAPRSRQFGAPAPKAMPYQPGTPTRDPRGVLHLTAGAIGGLDLLSAAAGDGGLTSASLTSTKTASTLVQPWMDASTAASLRTAAAPVTVFRGTVADAARLFPASLNVAAALAHATGLWDELSVTLIGDPAATHTTHHIAAEGPSGTYRFEIANHPLPDNPASSGLVSAALLRDIRAIAHPHGTFA